MSTISNCKRKTQENGRLLLEFPITSKVYQSYRTIQVLNVLNPFTVKGTTKFVCRTAYGKLYNIGKTQLQELINMQQNGAESADPDLSDTTNYGTEMRKKIEKFVETHNLSFTRQQIAAIQIPARSVVFKEMVFWMDDYFATCGEFMPDKSKLRIVFSFNIMNHNQTHDFKMEVSN